MKFILSYNHHEYDEGQNQAGNTGNVLHVYEGQNQTRKYGKCPS